MALTLTFHGHATFSLDIDGTHVVVDPFFAPNNPMAKKTAADISADYILQTHGHGDHIADTVPLAQRTGALVIANFEIANWLGAKGVEKVHPQHLGGGYNHPIGYVKMTPALHGSGLPDGSYGGMPGGFLLHVAGKKVYFSGDTAVFSDMKLIGDAGIDLAVLPIGDNFTMGPDDSLLAIKFLRPKVVVPCHYNTWPPIEQDAAAWAERVHAETDATPIVLNAEESYTL
ncbi:MAG: metal-dependent hydrolase [Ardenticatenaceae bacterium]|nr:metal-dependent hydrolase [Ardenticatenaceae bacterium]MCB8990540.1 metal-dependent hydrolase [Ardenticatenaceae bacterium]